MKNQFKYALRQGLSLRLTALGIMFVLSAVAIPLGYFSLVNDAVRTTALVLSSVTLGAIFVTNIIADTMSFQSVFKTPDAYLNAMTPVTYRRILCARLVSSVAEDLVALAAGIYCVVIQTLILSGDIKQGVKINFGSADIGAGTSVFLVCCMIVAYAFIFTLIIFAMTLKNSVLSGLRGRGLLSLIGTWLVIWALSLTTFALAPFGAVERRGIFFTIYLQSSFNAGVFTYAALALLQLVAVFFASAALLERRINLA